MTDRTIDLDSWERAAQYRLFRGFAQPHYAVTTRLDASGLVAARVERQVSPYRATLWAIGAGCAAVPALRTRFVGDRVILHDTADISMSVPRANGSFGFGYLPWVEDFAAFDRAVLAEAARVAAATDLDEAIGKTDVVYASALPWIDLHGLTNAMPGPDDCIPRIAWGRIVEEAGGHGMGMTVEVHHAVVDGAHLGAFFEAVQAAVDRV